jgi:hypothetical protein
MNIGYVSNLILQSQLLIGKQARRSSPCDATGASVSHYLDLFVRKSIFLSPFISLHIITFLSYEELEPWALVNMSPPADMAFSS